MEIVTTLLAVWDIAAQVIAVASAIAVITPWKEDDAIMAKIKGFINLFALNVGNAKPK